MVSEEAMKQADEYKAAGNKLMGLQKFEDAINNYTKAIELNSENESMFFGSPKNIFFYPFFTCENFTLIVHLHTLKLANLNEL